MSKFLLWLVTKLISTGMIDSAKFLLDVMNVADDHIEYEQTPAWIGLREHWEDQNNVVYEDRELMKTLPSYLVSEDTYEA